MEKHREELFGLLNRDKYFPQRYILYGEWMHAVHSVSYKSLPDRFLAFDLFDRGEGKFVNRETLETLLSGTGIHITRVMEKRDTIPTDGELRALVQNQSAFSEGRVEGVVVKIEDRGWVKWRGKVVRGDFLAGNQHWSKNIMQENGILAANIEGLDIAS
jgi:atypical dual specificity phosphatase